MKRRILALLICAALLLSLFGCSRMPEKPQKEEEPKQEEETPEEAAPAPVITDPVRQLAQLGRESGYENAFAELEITSEVQLENASFSRMQQNYHGVPVYGSAVTCIADGDGEMLAVTGNVQDVDASLSMTPSIRREKVEAMVRTHLENSFGALQQLTTSVPELCIFQLEGEARLAYSLRASVQGDGCGGVYQLVVDAHDGSLLLMESPLMSAEYVFGDLSGQHTAYSNVGYMEDSSGLVKTRQLRDPRRGITAYISQNEEQTVYEGSIYGQEEGSENILTIANFTKEGEPVTWSLLGKPNPIAVDAYVNTQIAYDYFESVLGNASTDGRGRNRIEIYTGVEFVFDTEDGSFVYLINNAASDTDVKEGVTYLLYGVTDDGQTIDAAQSLDVVAHEYMHGVEYSHSNMHSYGESGALKEALSDIFGELVEGWHTGAASDWQLGSRNIADPQSGGNPAFYGGEHWESPDNWETDRGNIHNNSTVISHAAWIMWMTGQFTDTELAQLWYRAMLMMPWKCTFSQCRTLVELAAGTMEMSEAQQAAIKNAFDAVGINVTEAPVYELEPDSPLTVLDRNDEPYDNYTVAVRRYEQDAIGGLASGDHTLFPVKGPLVERTEVTSQEPVVLDYEPGTYSLEITDGADPEKTVNVIVKLLDEDTDDSLTLYTDFGEANAVSVEFTMNRYHRVVTENGVDIYEYLLEYPVFQGDSPAEVLLNEGYARILAEWSAEIDEAALYQEIVGDKNPADCNLPYTEELRGEVTYNANGAFALVETGYFYLGGAHPNHYTYNYLYDIVTGEEITLDQILVGSEEEITEVLRHFAAECGVSGVDVAYLRERCAFALTEEGLSFHYQDPIMYRVQADILIPYTNEDLYVISAGELIRTWDS